MEEEDKMTKIPSTRHHFVLMHGMSHGAWCWYKIRTLLESSGHRVSCLDLAAAGIDPSDADTVLTFEEYNKPLIDFMSALPEDEKVILVGHSAGGLSLAVASLQFPEKIHLAIYVCAIMERSILDDKDFHGPKLSDLGDIYDFGFGLGPDKPPTSLRVRGSRQRERYYQLSPLEDSILSSMLLRPAPIMAIASARYDGGDVIDRVKRVYIKTIHDHALQLEKMDSMIERWPPSEVWTLESDHSPFFSAPNELFGLLIKAATSILCN